MRGGGAGTERAGHIGEEEGHFVFPPGVFGEILAKAQLEIEDHLAQSVGFGATAGSEAEEGVRAVEGAMAPHDVAKLLGEVLHGGRNFVREQVHDVEANYRTGQLDRLGEAGNIGFEELVEHHDDVHVGGGSHAAFGGAAE